MKDIIEMPYLSQYIIDEVRYHFVKIRTKTRPTQHAILACFYCGKERIFDRYYYPS